MDKARPAPVKSMFDKSGGYYSVSIDGVEFARWAPSNEWSKFWNSVADNEGWTYAWVVTD